MEYDKKVLALTFVGIFALAYFVSGTVAFVGVIGQGENETTNANTSLPTGGEGIPVITANGTEVAEAAPAESIVDLFNYILVVAVPAVVALGGMILGFIRMTGIGKKYEKQIGYVENGFKYVDTMAPKVKEQILDSGLAKTTTQIMLEKLDSVKPGLKAEVEAEIQQRTPQIQGAMEEAVDQINEFKSRVPPEWYADKDKNIPRPFTRPNQ
jgi:hypothetical protein